MIPGNWSLRQKQMLLYECAFKSATPMGNYCLIPLDILRNIMKYFGSVIKYTGSAGEKHLCLDSHSSLVKGDHRAINSPTVPGWAQKYTEHIFTYSPHNALGQKMRVKWWGETHAAWLQLHEAGQSLQCIYLGLLQKILEQCHLVVLSAVIKRSLSALPNAVPTSHRGLLTLKMWQVNWGTEL